MALLAGTRLGPYEITAPLGAGGMGEVYRARDTELKRDVAVKVLPSGVGSDPERLARFKREAELLAALNHPHVAQVYGLTSTPDGAPAMVMELVEGETLADLIARGPVAVSQALAIARQVADGLEAAHDAGVIHRDLKPANVKVRPDGTVKLLDFGLARTAAAPTADGSHAPTITSPAMTQAGVVLGTAAYMSPEQARGQVADARSDIWAFGCVLFELLTGRRAFPGDTIADVTAAVLSREPDWQLLPTSAQGPVERVLRRSLARERRERYAAIADVRYDLLARETATASDAQRGSAWRWAAALAALALSASVAWTTLEVTRPVNPRDPLTGVTVTVDQGRMTLGHAEVAFSPDGASLALQVDDDEGRGNILVTRLDGSQARLITGTEGGRGPAFSRDGRWIAFTANGKLAKVPREGGASVVLADAPHMHGVAWSLDDRFLYYSPNLTTGIFRVPSVGGPAEQVTRTDAGKGEVTHEWPTVAPDGRLVYVVNAQIRTFEDSHIVALDSASGRTEVLVRSAIAPRFTSDRLFFVNREGSMASAVLDGSGRLTGSPTPLGVRVFDVGGNGVLAAHDNGLIAFARGLDYAKRRIVVSSGTGPERPVSAAQPYMAVAASPDGRMLAATVFGGRIETTELDRPAWSAAGATADAAPLVWSSDNRTLVYTPALGRLATVSAAGRGVRDVASVPGVALTALGWLPNDEGVLIRKLGVPGLWHPSTSDPAGELQPTFESTNAMPHAAIEATRRLIAYASDFSGRYDVYLRSLDSPDPTLRVSLDAVAMEPRWSQDGRRLYFATGRGIQVVDVTMPPLRVSTPRPVPHVVNKAFSGGDRQTFAVLPDDRIVYIKEGDTAARDRLVLMQNWRTLLTATRDP